MAMLAVVGLCWAAVAAVMLLLWLLQRRTANAGWSTSAGRPVSGWSGPVRGPRRG